MLSGIKSINQSTTAPIRTLHAMPVEHCPGVVIIQLSLDLPYVCLVVVYKFAAMAHYLLWPLRSTRIAAP